jgi:hypothetical protein
MPAEGQKRERETTHSFGACESEFLKRVRGARATRLVNCMLPTLRGVKSAGVDMMGANLELGMWTEGKQRRERAGEGRGDDDEGRTTSAVGEGDEGV